jgi:hypothetical protein
MAMNPSLCDERHVVVLSSSSLFAVDGKNI